MNEIINEKLNELMIAEKTIYVLKGFNSIIKNLEIRFSHIFNTKINKEIENILKIDKNQFIFENINYLNTDKIYWCLYEELLFIEKNELFGIIEASGYNIVIIDIGCFDYYYPGIICESNKKCLEIFDEEKNYSNIIQKIYTSFELRNNIPIVSYNKFENDDKAKYLHLLESYSEYFKYRKHDEIKEIELFDNSTSEVFIQVFNGVFNGEYNTIKYTIIEGKDNKYIKKFLYILNTIGVNIVETTIEKEYKLPLMYDEYLKILKRKNENYNFKKINMYKDPFKNNEMIEVDQSIIIDTIYQNILKAQSRESFKDIFVTAPTGAGKSILFQIPAIMAAERKKLVTIVISPLIGLMKDQVNNIKVLTNCAATINSEYTPFEKEQIKKKIKKGEISILYISPESLLSNVDITSFIGDRQIGLLVIDEAHTVSTWGKNFRPDYWYLGDYLDKLRHNSKHIFPIATFTATATISSDGEDMYHDIVESLNMTCIPFLGDVKRKNIKFDIRNWNADHAYREEKEEKVINEIDKYLDKNEKTLVYFPFVKTLKEIYQRLPEEKIGRYYGSLDKIDKDATLEDVRIGNKNVVLATKAFGMGIDVEDIKNVYHFAPTGNLSDYVQEIGRAARKQEMTGIASTDYYKEDFKYINKLYGMSQITNYNIIGVLQKILYKYQTCGRRNFMISAEEFAHVFNAKDDKDIESQLKATIIAIKKDFKSKSNFVPLIFKPRSMYTTGLFYIPDSKMLLVRSYGWDKYIKKRFDRIELTKLDTDGVKTEYRGDVYEFDFKGCWQDNYNGKFNGITFGNFKRLFYEGKLENIDKSCFLDRSILRIEAKHGENLGIVLNKTLECLDVIKETFDDMKISNKQYRPAEIANIIYLKGIEHNESKIKNLVEPLLNLLISLDKSMSNGKYKFCNYNSKTDRYHIVTSYYERTIYKLKDTIKNYLSGYEIKKERRSIIDTNKSSDSQMRNNALLIAVQIMELIDVVTYNFEKGNSPEFFIRVNSETTIRKVVENKNYESQTLKAINNLHINSVRYMKYFFENLRTDEERWQFIEDYFLGQVEKKYNIPKEIKLNSKRLDEEKEDYAEETKENNSEEIRIYTLFDSEENESIKYYINDEEITELNKKGFTRISKGCEVAKNLAKCKRGDVFSVNKYEYLIEDIDIFEL